MFYRQHKDLFNFLPDGCQLCQQQFLKRNSNLGEFFPTQECYTLHFRDCVLSSMPSWYFVAQSNYLGLANTLQYLY